MNNHPVSWLQVPVPQPPARRDKPSPTPVEDEDPLPFDDKIYSQLLRRLRQPPEEQGDHGDTGKAA
mgnify:CR=1 FL=1